MEDRIKKERKEALRKKEKKRRTRRETVMTKIISKNSKKSYC